MNDILIRVDDAGRIIIPLKVRKQYDINKKDTLLLTTNSNGFELKKEDILCKNQAFFSKVKAIENSFNFNLLIASNEKIIYTSKIYINLKGNTISTEVKKVLNNKQKGYSKKFKITEDYTLLSSCYYTTLKLDNFTKCVAFITFPKEYKKEASLISELLS